MLNKFITLRKVKKLQDAYSEIYDKWAALEDESAKGILKCDLIDMALLYDELVGDNPITPIPGLSSKFVYDEESNIETDGILKVGIPLSSSKYWKKYISTNGCIGIGKKLHKVYGIKFHKAYKNDIRDLKQSLVDEGFSNSMLDYPEADGYLPIEAIANYIKIILFENRFKWKPKFNPMVAVNTMPNPPSTRSVY